MVKLKLYKKDNLKRAVGTFYAGERYSTMSLRFPPGSDLQIEYEKTMKHFMEKNNLYIVHGLESFTRRNTDPEKKTKVTGIKGFDTYILKRISSGTKIALQKIRSWDE